MIGLDTNVLVRYLTQDDPLQSIQANAFVELVQHPFCKFPGDWF